MQDDRTTGLFGNRKRSKIKVTKLMVTKKVIKHIDPV